MRALFVFATLALGSASTLAQAQNRGVQRPAADTARDTAQLSREIAQQRAAGEKYLPDAANFTFGDRTISANTRVDGPIAVAHGNLDVYGTVDEHGEFAVQIIFSLPPSFQRSVRPQTDERHNE